MKQVTKFYLASFLKNQTYFVPVLVIFFQDLGLSYTEIFAILTIGSAFSFLIEIPTGILADLYGRRLSIILSKWTIFGAFVAFGFASGFWSLLLAQLIYELGKSFRSGTETAYVYDYLEADKEAPSYTRVKAMQKFYARVSESIATAAGGWLAVQIGFSPVFFLAAVPAFVNALQTHTWVKLDEAKVDNKRAESKLMTKAAWKDIRTSRTLTAVLINVAVYTSVFVALGTLIQPYMEQSNVPLAYFGFIYSAFLILAAFLTRYASNLEERFGGARMMNVLTLLPVIPLFLVGFGPVHWIGIGLLFVVLMAENIRSPIANTLFHDAVEKSRRATMGSILALSKTGMQIAFLPLIGLLADAAPITVPMIVFAGVLLCLSFFARVKGRTKSA